MGFLHKVNKISKFVDKGIHKAENFGQKIVKGANKGLHIADKVANIADKTLGALESVPVVGELAGAARPLVKQGQNLIKGGEVGLNKIDNRMAKLKNTKLRLM